MAHESDKFRTICYRCNLHYEYLKAYLDRTVVYPSCYMPFLAAEMVVPTSFTQPAVQATYPSGPGSYAQMPQLVYCTQPTAQATRWAPSSSGSYAQMAPPMGYTQPVAHAAEMALLTSFTQPAVQATQATYPSGPGSYAQMPQPLYYTRPAGSSYWMGTMSYGSYTLWRDAVDLSKWHVYVTGHSLGCALATLLALELSSSQLAKKATRKTWSMQHGLTGLIWIILASRYLLKFVGINGAYTYRA